MRHLLVITTRKPEKAVFLDVHPAAQNEFRKKMDLDLTARSEVHGLPW